MSGHPMVAALRGAAVGVLAVLIALLPLGAEGAASADVVEDSFDQAECPVDVPDGQAARVTCGVLIVPERRTEGSDPERTLRLPVAVIASTAGDPAEDPLVFPTSGGPGGGSLNWLPYFLEYGGWAGDRDIILIEQRGDQLAEPTLNCPELDPEHFISDGKRLSGEADRARYLEQLEACWTRLIEDGVDPSAYTSAESVQDLADLRTALGYDQWNIYGVSYGARLALTAMRSDLEGLRSVVLDGVYPPQINRYEQLPAGFLAARDTLYADCAADADCRVRYPDLASQLEDVLDRAARTPFSVTVEDPVDGSPVALEIDDEALVRGMFDAFYDPQTIRVLPFLIDRLAHGDADAAIPLAQRSLDSEGYFDEGLSLSIDCAEEAPFNDDARIAEALAQDPMLEHFALSDGFREDCALWAVPPLGEVENAAVTSGIPTLLTTGQYDPVTPVAFAESTAATLSTHYLYTFPAIGHGAVVSNWYDDCAAGIARQFLDDPQAEPDSSCIDEMPPPDFLTATDIQATPAIYRLDRDLVQDRDPLQLAIGALTLLVLGATLVYGVVYGLSWLRSRRGEAPEGAVLVATTAAVLNLGFAIGLVLILLNVDTMILAFGLPSGAWPLLVLPFVAMAVTVLLGVIVVQAWRRDEGTGFHRVALTISALGSACFFVWLLARGMLIL